MKHYAVTILTAVSTLVCVVALWNWAFRSMGTTRIGWTPGGFALISMDASDHFVTQELGDTSSDVLRRLRFDIAEQHHFLGFGRAHGRWRGSSFWLVVVPYWFIVGLTAILPVRWWVLRRRRRSRSSAGRCLDCGYDLRGSPERCPECGASASTPSPTAESAIIGR